MKVERGKPRVIGSDPQAPGLLVVEVDLTPRPDEPWTEIFGGGAFGAPPGVSISLSTHPPELRGSTVRLTPPDDEVERYMEDLDRRIEATNEHYAQTVVPELERQRREERERAETERRGLKRPSGSSTKRRSF